MSGRKSDQLDRKRRRTEVFRFEIEDPTAAEQAVMDARLAALRTTKGTPEAEAAEKALQAAGEVLAACYGTVSLRAMPPRVQLHFQQEAAERAAALEAEHKAAVAAAEEAGDPVPDAPEPPESTWDADSIEVRIISACDAEGRSPERWAEVLDLDGEWTLEERDALLAACFAVNKRHTFNPAVLGKGWPASRA